MGLDYGKKYTLSFSLKNKIEEEGVHETAKGKWLVVVKKIINIQGREIFHTHSQFKTQKEAIKKFKELKK